MCFTSRPPSTFWGQTFLRLQLTVMCMENLNKTLGKFSAFLWFPPTFAPRPYRIEFILSEMVEKTKLIDKLNFPPHWNFFWERLSTFVFLWNSIFEGKRNVTGSTRWLWWQANIAIMSNGISNEMGEDVMSILSTSMRRRRVSHRKVKGRNQYCQTIKFISN